MVDGGRITSLALIRRVVATLLLQRVHAAQMRTSLPTPPPQLESLLETIASSPPAKSLRLPLRGWLPHVVLCAARAGAAHGRLSERRADDASPAAKDVKARRELWEGPEEW